MKCLFIHLSKRPWIENKSIKYNRYTIKRGENILHTTVCEYGDNKRFKFSNMYILKIQHCL